ncbi:MAG: hypothetical protein AAFQ98_06185 [Bacteroidota bacterium]
MKHHLYCLLILLPLAAPGQGIIHQEDLMGDWLVVSSERKDGSSVIEYEPQGLILPLYWYVGRKDICNYKLPWGKTSCSRYELYESSRRISLLTGQQYEIDYMEGDTLVISQVDKEKTDDKLSRYLLVRGGVWEPETPPSPMGNAVYFPQYGPVLRETNLIHKLEQLPISGRAEYKLTFDFDAKTLSVEQLTSSFTDPKTEGQLLKLLMRSYRDWSFHSQSRYPQVVQYLTVQANMQGPNPTRIWYNTWEQVLAHQAEREQIRDAHRYFQSGLVQFHENRLDSAIALFTDAYQMDSVMISAVYNRAAVYWQQGNEVDACEDWLHLAQRGQIMARNRWNKDCK